MGKVVTLGEIMLRLSPEGYGRFVQAQSLGVAYGGGEANVAVTLSHFGVDAQFVTKLPRHEMGQAAINSLRQFGVDTTEIVRGDGRLGLYFLERGASQRPSKVIYDRAGSAFATAQTADFDWDRILEGADWFHFTGIAPALGDNVAAICLEACKAAKAKGVTVCCDLNYRKNLWSRQKAGEVMAMFMEYVDVCIANEEHVAELFGIRADSAEIVAGEVTHAGLRDVAIRLAARFNFQKVGMTMRESLSADDNNWGAMLYDGNDCYFSRKYKIHMVDRVGSGDSFCGGLIYACLHKFEPQAAVNFAVAAGVLKHSIEGDFNHISADEAQALAQGDGSGRVQR